MACYQRILLATDLAESTTIVSKKAFEIAQLHEAEVFVVHVVEPVVIDSAYDIVPTVSMEMEEQLIDSAKKKIAELARNNSISTNNVSVESGSTKAEILRVAKDKNIDLIVLGSHGRHGVALLLGSTANAVLHGAQCDVLAVRIK